MRLAEGRTSDLRPVLLRIALTRDGAAHLRARNRPSRLGDPDPSAGLDPVHHVSRVLYALPEHVVCVVDIRVLIVRIAIHADKVTRLDHGRVRRVHPRRPRIHMADLDASGTHARQHVPHLINLSSQRTGAGIVTVQILATDGDADDPPGAVCLYGGLQRGLLGIIVVCILRPDADEQLGARIQSGRDGIGERAAVRRREEAGAGEVTRQRLHGAEGVFPVLLGFAGAVGVVGADVEALPVGGCRRGEDGRQGSEGSE